jgi:hypothetical protein
MNAQAELFEKSDRPAPDQSAKLFRGANGVELPYWEAAGKIIQIALSDKLVLPVTQQKGGHIYANVPGEWGRLEKKTKISFLSAAAQIRRAIQINESIQRELKEQHELLSGASEIRAISPARERTANKLATKPIDDGAEPLHFFNPKALIRSWHFSPVPTWLQALPQITPAQQLVYAAMIFRADEDGIFRRSVLSLGELVRLSARGLQKAIKSMEEQHLVFKATSHLRAPNEYKFVWLAAFDKIRRSEQRSLEFVTPSEQKSPGGPNAVSQAGEQHSLHKNKEPVSKKHDHAHARSALTPGQQDLMNQLNELTESENRNEQFRKLWETLLKEDEIAVFQAIGETRCLKREGKIKKTVGGAVYWHYKNFHKGNLTKNAKSAQPKPA